MKIFFSFVSLSVFASLSGLWHQDIKKSHQNCPSGEQGEVIVHISESADQFQVKNFSFTCLERTIYRSEFQTLDKRDGDLLKNGHVIGRISDDSFYFVMKSKGNQLQIIRGDKKRNHLTFFFDELKGDSSKFNLLTILNKK